MLPRRFSMVNVWVTIHDEPASKPPPNRPPAVSSSSAAIPHVEPSNSASEVSFQYDGRSAVTVNSTVSERSPSRPRTSTKGSTIRPGSVSRPIKGSESAPGIRGPTPAASNATTVAVATIATDARVRCPTEVRTAPESWRRRWVTATIAVSSQTVVTSDRWRSSPTMETTAKTTAEGTNASPRPAARNANASARIAAMPTEKPAANPNPVANSRGGFTSPSKAAESPMRVEISAHVRPSGMPYQRVS